MPIADASVLVTGGTGVLGALVVDRLLADARVRRVVVYSRDELRQWEAAQRIGQDPRVRFFIGDVKDAPRLVRALHGVDHVVHAASAWAPAHERMNAEVLEHTNVGGTKAVIAACLEAGVARAVLVSSCEAAAPTGLVGATRLVAEELFVAANAYGGGAFAVVRAPHLARGRRSLFASLAPDHPQPARLRHHPRATQFVAGGEAVTEAVLTALGTALPGERLVPRARSASASSIAALFGTEDRLAEGGAVPTHERLVGPMEEPYTSIVGDLLRVRPAGDEPREGSGAASAPASGPASSPASAAAAFQSNDRAALLPRAELRRFWAEELRAHGRTA